MVGRMNLGGARPSSIDTNGTPPCGGGKSLDAVPYFVHTPALMWALLRYLIGRGNAESSVGCCFGFCFDAVSENRSGKSGILTLLWLSGGLKCSLLLWLRLHLRRLCHCLPMRKWVALHALHRSLLGWFGSVDVDFILSAHRHCIEALISHLSQ